MKNSLLALRQNKMESKIRSAELRSLIRQAAEASETIKNGMTIAVGGYTSCGYPKAVIRALADRANAGEELRLNVISGSNNGIVDTILAAAGAVTRCAPMIESKIIAAQVNNGSVTYCEQQMNKMPNLLRSEAFGHIDVAVVEAIAINADGSFVPSSSVGFVPLLVELADRVIIEVNAAMPEQLEGMHDVYVPDGGPIPITSAEERIGVSSIACDIKKIFAIVITDELDEVTALAPAKPEQTAIADNLFNFLELEMTRRGIVQLPPIQTGFGSLAAEIVNALGRSNFSNISFFGGVAQEANIRLAASGKVRAISCGSVKMSPVVRRLIEENEMVRNRVIIRNGEITNNSEVISRLAPITLTSGIEMDIYGNVNSSHIAGSKIVNGIGGGANFAANAGLSIMMIASTGKGGSISTIVPMVSHQDISEHDIDVVVTENGVADLRGKSDIERAHEIIENCAGEYKDQLRSYFNRAISADGHHPILLDEALSWHIKLKQTGSMML